MWKSRDYTQSLTKPSSGWNWVIVIPWITSVSHAGEWIEYYKRIKFVSYVNLIFFEYYAAPADLEYANLVSDFAILAIYYSNTLSH